MMLRIVKSVQRNLVVDRGTRLSMMFEIREKYDVRHESGDRFENILLQVSDKLFEIKLLDLLSI